MTLSVCLIVKNEEEVLPRCLNCVKTFADEIIVVDTGSTDGTTAVAKQYTDKVHLFEWCYDFSAARNFSLSKAGSDFIMWLDADDVISAENCKKIREVMKNPGFDMAFLQYAAASDGGEPALVYYRERIFRRSKNYRFAGAVHEAVPPSGKIEYLDITVLHDKIKAGDPLRNLGIYQRRISGGALLDERDKFYYGRELLFNRMYRESIAVLENFLSGGGWIENKIEACLNLAEAYFAMGDAKKAEEALLKTFSYAAPRSAACCMLGNKFLAEGDCKSAIYWYEAALTADNAVKNGGFFNPDYCGFIPLIQLCVAYDRLGDFETANRYNEKAGNLKPRNSSYLANKRYFSEKLNIKV